MTATGDCFLVAARLVEEDESLVLCHGHPMRPDTGVRFWHAWVETTEEIPHCIEKSNGYDVTMPRSVYYDAGSIDPAEVARYDATEMRIQMLRHEHYGPWDGSIS